MSDAPARVLRQYLRTTLPAPATDGDLLARYAATRDEAAFAELVRRHGPMVLGTARRVLGADPAAEDAFQLAFLALARRARWVRGASLAGWLYRTTVRTAIRVHKRRPENAPPFDAADPHGDPFGDVVWAEARQVLDRELMGLPDRLRVPLVLCYLEAQTRDEAAARLGWSLRTLERRLAKGRDLLRTRLERRGLGAVGLAAVAAGCLASPFPAALAARTVRESLTTPIARLASLKVWYAVAGMALAVGVALGLGAFQPKAPADAPPAKAEAKAAEQPPAAEPDRPLPPGAIRRYGSLGWRHNVNIQDAVLSADGKTLVTAGDNSLAVWDVATGRAKLYLKDLDLARPFEPGVVAVAADGSWVAYLTGDRPPVRIVDVATGKERLTFTPPGPAADGPLAAPGNRNIVQFHSLRITPDGKTLLYCKDKKVTAFDPTTGKVAHAIDLLGRVMAQSPDGKRWFVHDQENPSDAYVCDAATGKVVKKLDGNFFHNNGYLVRAAFTADGKRLATASNLKPEVEFWDAETGKLVSTFNQDREGIDGRLAGVALTPDGRTVLAGGLSGAGVRRWEVATGKERPVIADPRPSVTTLLTDAAGRTLFLCAEGEIRRIDLATGKPLPPPAGHAGPPSVAQSPDGKLVVTADVRDRVFVWDGPTGKLLRELPVEGDAAGVATSFSADGKVMFCLNGDQLVGYDTTTWRVVRKVGRKDITGRAYQLVGDTAVLSISDRGGLMCRDAKTGADLWVIAEPVLTTAVSADGKAVAVSLAGRIAIVNAADKAERLVIKVEPPADTNVAFQNRADALAFSPDGRLLAATRWDMGEVFVWDVATGREVYKLVGHKAPVETRLRESSIAFSPDGRYLASGNYDHTTRVWEVATGKEVRKLAGQESNVHHVSFARDGRTLLTAAGVEVLAWDLLAGADPKADVATLWNDLAADDAGKAYTAIVSLAARGESATTFLKGKLAPVPVVEAGEIAKRVKELDSNRFAVREAATKILTDLGPLGRPALEAALNQKPSAEAAARIEEMIARLNRPRTGDEARAERAVQALSWTRDPAARKHLADLAAGAPGALVTEAAKQAIRAGGD